MRYGMGDSRIKDISTLLSSFFDVNKLNQGERYSSFFSSWPRVVGPRLAAHSRVADVEKGLLIVEADHPGWIQLLQIRQSSILEDVSRQYPELGLRGILFRLFDPKLELHTPTPFSEETVKETKIPNGHKGKSFVTQQTVQENPVAENIMDPEFKALFSSLKKTMQDKS
jgi:hypothetical protein